MVAAIVEEKRKKNHQQQQHKQRQQQPKTKIEMKPNYMKTMIEQIESNGLK